MFAGSLIFANLVAAAPLRGQVYTEVFLKFEDIHSVAQTSDGGVWSNKLYFDVLLCTLAPY